MAKNYSKVPVKVQKRSGFDKSFQNLFTSKVGTITPILVDELIPNTKVNLRAAITASLPPLASDTFMRCKLKYAAFFCPTRLLFPGYEKWLTGQDKTVKLPKLTIPNAVWTTSGGTATEKRMKMFGPGTLADFLGYKIPEAVIMNSDKYTYSETDSDSVQRLNALPFMAYHKIYNDWFRNSLVQKDIFNDKNLFSVSAQLISPADIPFVTPSNDQFEIYAQIPTTGSPNPQRYVYADGVSIMELRQANFGYDMFTSANPKAQNGEAQSVSMAPVGNNESGFTISALRAANSMQQFLERNNLAGNRLVDFVRAQYGAHLSDSIAQRPILLGKGSFDVYSKGVYQTSNLGYDSYESNNPFTSVGSRYGSAYADGTDMLVNDFTAEEPGYLMVLAWLSPKVTYGTGIDPILTRYSKDSVSDMANPILQNVGNEPIFSTQIDSRNALCTPLGIGRHIFGYGERYCQWKDKMDEVHGLLRDTSNLESFALQRCFGGNYTSLTYTDFPEISSDFLKIPTDYLDQVSAVKGDVSKFGYWCDTYFDYKVSMPLAEYSVPSLQDPAYEHGNEIMIDKNGKQLN